MENRTRGRLLAPLLITAAIAAPTVAPASAGASPNPFRHDVAMVNSHLRIAVEERPEAMFEAMETAETVCGLGRRATERGETEVAAADWTTLAQVVEEPAEGNAHRIDVAFANADSTLMLMERRYVENRAIPASRRTPIEHAIGQTRHGIRIMRTAVRALAKPFESWRDQECQAATLGVEEAFGRTETGLRLINAGMQGLWRLAGVKI